MKKALSAVLVLIGWLVYLNLPEPLAVQRVNAQESEAKTTVCAGQGQIVLHLGTGDELPTDWSGSATGWLRKSSGQTSVQNWDLKSESSPLKLAGGGLQERILAAEVVLELPEVPCGAQIDQGMSIDVRTVPGNFTLRPLQSELGVLLTALDGRVKYERVPVAENLTSGSTEEDYPDCSVLGDSSVLCAYVEYDLGVPVDTEATLAGDFNSLRASPENSPDMLAVEAEFILNCLLSVN